MIQRSMTRKRILLLSGLAFLIAFLLAIVVDGSTLVCRPPRIAQLQIEIVGSAVDQYRTDIGEYPAGLEQLLEPLEAGSKWLGPYVGKRNLRDPWGRSLYYRVADDGRSFLLFTLGKDGRIGGDDADADFGAQYPEQIHPVAAGK